MPRRKKRLGHGASVSVLARFLHPSQPWKDKFLNNYDKARATELGVIGREPKIVRRKETDCVLVSHIDFPGQVFHVALQKVVVTEEGPESELFGGEINEEENMPDDGEVNVETGDDGIEDQARIIAMQRVGADLQGRPLQELRAAGIQVDDDNEPVPENIPQPGQRATAEGIYSTFWGHDGIDFRRTAGGVDSNPTLKSVNSDVAAMLTPLQMFELFFPIEHVKQVVLVRANETLSTPLLYGEFLTYLGVWFLMATCFVGDRREFWSSDTPSPWSGAPFRVNQWMSRRRFDAITQALRYTNEEAPEFRDPFYPVRQLIVAWNENMARVFGPSWISCLDESMSEWTSKWTCPGWMFVPRKPHPQGMEWHTICCCLCGVLWQLELVEGKDRPRSMPAPEFQELGPTTGLLLRLTRPIWHTGKFVCMDSGFCVLEALVQLRRRGVFSSALIKKRRYWPKYINGDEIDQHFEDFEVGQCDALKGNLNGTDFYIYGMKEPDYVMKIMSTCLTLNEEPKGDTARSYKNSNGAPVHKTFKYTQPFYYHFQYRHQIDDHNGKRHAPISLETTWGTQWWPHRVFAFLLAVTEVNAKLMIDHFNQRKETGSPTAMLEFRRQLVRELLNNPYKSNDGEEARPNLRRRVSTPGHGPMQPPHYTKKFKNGSWQESTVQYLQRRCNCGKKTRTYCLCDKTTFYCVPCLAGHLAEV